MHQIFNIEKSELLDLLKSSIDPRKVSREVLRLSDLYSSSNPQTQIVWQDQNLVDAYLSYFMPLNLLRIKSVLRIVNELGFFNGIENFYDFGSGPGTADLAHNECSLAFEKFVFMERDHSAQLIHKNLLRKLQISFDQRIWQNHVPQKLPLNTLVFMSYSLNEIDKIPAEFLTAEAVIIIEPSTRNAGRKLMDLRQQLIDVGFHPWAPCTHQKKCPLLIHSKSDWCHNRIHVELTPQLKQIEKFLPIKNHTLTYSYLAMRRTPRENLDSGRVIGDTLFEKGKVRQAYCRNENREFLSWLTKEGKSTGLTRGSLFKIPENSILKNNEIRISQHPTNSK